MGLAADLAHVLEASHPRQADEDEDGRYRFLEDPAASKRKGKSSREDEDGGYNDGAHVGAHLGIDRKGRMARCGGHRVKVPCAGNGEAYHGIEEPLRAVAHHPRPKFALLHADRRDIAKEPGEHERRERPKEGGWRKSGIKEAVPEVAAFYPRAGSQHEAQYAVYYEEAHPREYKIKKGHPEAQVAFHGVEMIMVDQQGDDLAEEEGPFDSPGENEVVDERRYRRRAYEAEDKPDAHTGNAAENHC
ncbi:MAG: hypothetical protein BWY96_02058 [Spirochaetes bacterium ADurb.BinA120]|nr:MAG: hypothetical protein BWY96_02058 [Spirochaetes bacterium ADurb.BinA120]